MNLAGITVQTPLLYLQQGLQEAPQLVHTQPAELSLVQPADTPSNTRQHTWYRSARMCKADLSPASIGHKHTGQPNM